MAEVLRTPEERFADLPDFPYPPCYIDSLQGYEGLRMHYVDAGAEQAEQVFLCLHGEPTWSYCDAGFAQEHTQLSRTL